ncbi:MAG: polyprenyl synthetase family protein [Phycisphaerales bacterium]|nr:polyprenyl synthetase family protein [Phycisphaerales bacterium]
MQGVLDIPAELSKLESLLFESLPQVEKVFADQLISDLPPVDEMCQHVERYRGKMLRPSLVLLCGAAANLETDSLLAVDNTKSVITQSHIVCGAVSEMVHMATLVHDDVLDEAEIRRRGQTINMLKGNETSVILGDYLIASAYELCSSLNSPVPSRIVGNASAVMCSGELLQLHHRNNLSLDEATYIEILERKTAALIGAACELGSLSTLGFDQSDHPTTIALKSFGVHLGVAFQIQDDVLDILGTTETVGKSVGKDLDKGKLTYPLIHHLSVADVEQGARSLILIQRAANGETTVLPEIVESIQTTKSIEATKSFAASYVVRAKEALTTLPPSSGRSMLELIADAVIQRSY